MKQPPEPFTSIYVVSMTNINNFLQGFITARQLEDYSFRVPAHFAQFSAIATVDSDPKIENKII